MMMMRSTTLPLAFLLLCCCQGVTAIGGTTRNAAQRVLSRQLASDPTYPTLGDVSCDDRNAVLEQYQFDAEFDIAVPTNNACVLDAEEQVDAVLAQVMLLAEQRLPEIITIVTGNKGAANISDPVTEDPGSNGGSFRYRKRSYGTCSSCWADNSDYFQPPPGADKDLVKAELKVKQDKEQLVQDERKAALSEKHGQEISQIRTVWTELKTDYDAILEDFKQRKKALYQQFKEATSDTEKAEIKKQWDELHQENSLKRKEFFQKKGGVLSKLKSEYSKTRKKQKAELQLLKKTEASMQKRHQEEVQAVESGSTYVETNKDPIDTILDTLGDELEETCSELLAGTPCYDWKPDVRAKLKQVKRR